MTILSKSEYRLPMIEIPPESFLKSIRSLLTTCWSVSLTSDDSQRAVFSLRLRLSENRGSEKRKIECEKFHYIYNRLLQLIK